SEGETKAEILVLIDAQLDKIADAWEAVNKTVAKAEEAMAAHIAAGGKAEDGAYAELVTELEKLDAEDLSKNTVDAVDTNLKKAATEAGSIKKLEAATLDLTIHQDAKDAMSAYEAAYKAIHGADATASGNVYDKVKVHV